MERQTENKIVLVKRRTRLEDLVMRYNTIGQAKFYIEHMGSDFSDYVAEDRQYKTSISEAYKQLEVLGRVQILDREFIPNFIFGMNDIVVAIGQDGLVANTMKYLSDQYLVGVNPDCSRWDGILLPFSVNELKFVVQDVIRRKRSVKEVTMAKAILNDGQTIYAVNDLFIGQKTHVSSRYQIMQESHHEYQSSSGIIVSTGLGSTGWLKSVLSGVQSIVSEISHEKNKNHYTASLPWDVDYLCFSVREPFPSKTSKADLVFGKITLRSPLKVLSQMPENGVIFSDGVESDFVQFNSGIEATITIAERKGKLVV